MAKYKVHAVYNQPREVIFEIADGDDWDGRPVADKFDAGDYAYDLALEKEPDADWQIELVEVIND